MRSRQWPEKPVILPRSFANNLPRYPDLAAAVERELFNATIACEIYALRGQAGLTQRELAQRVGTHQSVIARLEDADYDGHSLNMLQRIAAALGKRVEIKFVSPRTTPPARVRRKSHR